MRLRISYTIVSLLLLACAGCIDLTGVQKNYVADRDECRGKAEDKIGDYTQPDTYQVSTKEKNTALLFLFCECMKGHDWNVAGCKGAKAPAATAVASSANPAAASAAAVPPGYMLVPLPQNVPQGSPGAGAGDADANDRIHFDYNKAIITPDDQAVLQEQAVWLKQHPSTSVIIEGHCDQRGTREYNLALGERRAVAAKNYLVGLGIAPNRIQTTTLGKERPEALGSDESAWSRNRRAVTVIPGPSS